MSNSRILKNTLALYTRQIIIIFITLYSLRVVLNELGTDDYGVYSVITGFVTLLAFLPGSMASATQLCQRLPNKYSSRLVTARCAIHTQRLRAIANRPYEKTVMPTTVCAHKHIVGAVCNRPLNATAL